MKRGHALSSMLCKCFLDVCAVCDSHHFAALSWSAIVSHASCGLHAQADQEDLRAFENASASARSQGLFFKNLYQPEQEPQQQQSGQGEDAASSSSGSSRNRALVDPVAARQAAAVVTSSAEDEVGSPFRMYLFGYMAAVLVAVVLQGGRQGACQPQSARVAHRYTATQCLSEHMAHQR
jgi:hypothetical protein